MGKCDQTVLITTNHVHSFCGISTCIYQFTSACVGVCVYGHEASEQPVSSQSVSETG